MFTSHAHNTQSPDGTWATRPAVNVAARGIGTYLAWAGPTTGIAIGEYLNEEENYVVAAREEGLGALNVGTLCTGSSALEENGGHRIERLSIRGLNLEGSSFCTCLTRAVSVPICRWRLNASRNYAFPAADCSQYINNVEV